MNLVRTIIAFGSNLGKREENIRLAISLLSKEMEIEAVSSLLISEPAEGVSGGSFLNGALLARTVFGPGKLLEFLQGVEQAVGRPMRHEPGEARLIDLDIIYYGNLVCDRPGLRIPHRRRLERFFVICPAAEIAPFFVDPVVRRPLVDMAAGHRKGFSADGSQVNSKER